MSTNNDDMENKENAISFAQTKMFSPSKVAFDVFLDELLDIPIEPATKQTSTSLSKKPLNSTIQATKKEAVKSKSTSNPENLPKQEALVNFEDRAYFNTNGSVDKESSIKQTTSALGIPRISFKTASGKTLNPVSEEATRRAQALLNDPLDSSQLTKESASNPSTTTDTLSGFKTASGKNLKPVSEESLLRANALFSDQNDLDNASNESNSTDSVTAPDRLGVFFTTALGKTLTAPKQESKNQVARLFAPPQEELEDKGIKRPLDIAFTERNMNQQPPLFSNQSTQNSGKIREKQNKPFKSPIIRSNIELTKAAVDNKSILRTRGLLHSKRNKLSILGKPLQYTRQQLLFKDVPFDVINMTSSISREYLFNNWGPKQAQEEMIDMGALPNKLPLFWVKNHYGWIVWKLACQIRSYPDIFLKDWKPETILHQLLYRYEREINQGHRPALKMILDQDDIAAKHMILVISNITEINTSLFYNTSSKYRLQLTDGWYQIPACIDLRMEHAITRNRLRIGYKLSISGARLVRNRAVQSSIEDEESSKLLCLSANSCLPASWDTRLGYHPKKYITRSLSQIFDDGGMVTALDVVVCRKFPMLYKETLPNGTSITRTAGEEESVRSGEMLETDTTVNNFNSESAAQNVVNINLEDRKVTGYFKMRICDYQPHPSSGDSQQWATLLLLNTNELNHMDITEGSRFRIFFVIPYYPNNKKYPGFYFKTTRMTRWEPVRVDKKSPYYIPRYITQCSNIRQQNTFLDFDMTVLIMQINPGKCEYINGRKLWRQTILATDQSQSICRIDFRLPVQPCIVKGQVVGFVNLRFELYDSKYDITCLKTTDESEFVLKSSVEYMHNSLKALQVWTQSHSDIISSIHEKIQTIVQ
ncbi:hypothetical protein G6F46_002873 [Rhizopus delemar]|nr:hypothetical protein G6F55_000217 [Rhizopus delemar]KAG1551300.1 hypothetical protein G6F51_001939 [Rhizopus arrhizus]KAG1503386.1 hypothetical protein G6F54_001719 [Rhizopus delemar]KAG1516056.1 hypothetical protein G6F53_002457 [Rhizopus delemar]KAG1522359.1 hypothetical protein G6F52_005931 [Rhizopus delemar]